MYQDRGIWNEVWWGPQPPLNNTIEAVSDLAANVLTDWNENYIEINVEIDYDVWDGEVVVQPYWIFEDEKYVIQGDNAWLRLFESMERWAAARMIPNYTEFPSDVFAALQAFYENPTEANYQVAEEALGNWYPLPPLENVIHHPSEDSVLLFNTIGEWDFIQMYIHYDEQTDEPEVVVVPNWIFSEGRYVIDWGDVWESMFEGLDVEQVSAIIAKPRWFPEDIFLALKAVYENPSAETVETASDKLENRCVVDSVKVSNKAFPVSIEGGAWVKMFLTPDLVNSLEISVDLNEEDPYLEYTGEGYFDIEAGLAEAVSYLMDAFDSVPNNVERADRNIFDFADLSDWDTGGTIQPECMSLVQALFDNPTEDNRDALVTYLSQFDPEYEWDLLISDDEAASIIKADLVTLNPEEFAEQIEDAWDVWEFDIVINQRTYHFTATSDEAADANVNIKGLYYQTSAAVEEWNPQIQVWEVTLTEGGGR